MRLLIVSYLYAPDRSPRAYRWTAVAEEWARHGHQVQVVAAWKTGDARAETLNCVEVLRVGGGIGQRLRGWLGRRPHAAGPAPAPAARGNQGARGLVRRLAKAVYDLTWRRLYWPDYAAPWYFPALSAADRLLAAGQWDAVFTVSHPFTAHVVGLALKRRHPKLPWIADTGDPFAFFREIPLNNHRLYGRLNLRTEAAVVASADIVPVTVDACRDAYTEAFPGRGHLAVIPPLLSLPEPPPAPEPLGAGTHLVYVGTLYRAIRNPAWLLDLVGRLVADGLDLHLHFYGDIHDCGEELAAGAQVLGERLHLHGTVPRAEVARALAAADVLVNLGNSTPHQLPSKVVEYAASGKAVLNLTPTPDDTSARFLAGTGAVLTLGTSAPVAAADVAAAASFLAAPPRPDPARIAAIVDAHKVETIAAAYLSLIGPTRGMPTCGGKTGGKVIKAVAWLWVLGVFALYLRQFESLAPAILKVFGVQ